MRIRNALIAAGALVLAGPAGAALYIKIPDAGGNLAQGGSVDGFRWEAKGAVEAAPRAAAQPRYKAEGGRLVRIEDDGEAETGGSQAERLARPVRAPERDERAVLTRPLAGGSGMLVVRAQWRTCSEGARFASAELGESGGGAVTIEDITVVSCAGETFALNYEKIK